MHFLLSLYFPVVFLAVFTTMAGSSLSTKVSSLSPTISSSWKTGPKAWATPHLQSWTSLCHAKALKCIKPHLFRMCSPEMQCFSLQLHTEARERECTNAAHTHIHYCTTSNTHTNTLSMNYIITYMYIHMFTHTHTHPSRHTRTCTLWK